MSLKSTMFGLHIGDSLGATLEFTVGSPEKDTHTEIIGGGIHRWSAGAPTDDTEMAMMVLQSMISSQKFDIYELSARFIDWLATDPADVGRTTYLAINNMRNGVSPFKSGLSNNYDQGNGSLMRCAPLAYFDVSREEIYRQTAITHNSPICQLADFILISAIKNAEAKMDKFEIFSIALEQAKENKKLYEYLIQIPETEWSDLNTSGYVVHTLGAAFWGLLKTDNFEDALVYVVNRGDDADSVGAVCGAICGAYYGEEQIPIRWLEKIQLRDEIERLCSI